MKNTKYLSISVFVLTAAVFIVSCASNRENTIQESEEVSFIEYKDANKVYFILRVTDLEKSKEFYKDIFGFNVLFEIPDYVELSLPIYDVRISLNLVEEGTLVQGSGQLQFYVQDVNAVRDYVTRKGAETRDVEIGYLPAIEEARSRYGYDLFIMLDPSGNEILFI